MIVLIAFAKTMTNTWSGFKSTSKISSNEVTSKEITSKELTTEPIWLKQAMQYAQIAACLSSSEIADLLKVTPKIAAETKKKFDLIANGEAELLPSLAAYSGAVFRQINVNNWSTNDWTYAQNCIRIPSCIYGMLRPLDRISPYRMEGNVKLSKFSKNKTLEKAVEQTLFQEWRDKLTPILIEDIKTQDGILVNLASEEMKKFFNWSDIENDSTITIVKPDFYQLKEDGSLKSVSMYAKMCRGAMVRYIIKNRINKIDDLKKFTWDGFEFSPTHSTKEHLIFIRH